jgi:CPA2 family monovalent cation:H+ antiporter-2
MDSWSLLAEIVVLLGACLVCGGICSWLKQSPLVGYLLAGMFLGGPGSFHVVQAETHIEAIAELGVALLLFSLGLEFSFGRLLGLGARSLASGGIQVVVTGAVATGVGVVFQFSIVESIAVGMMVSLSSTAAVLRVLIERSEIESLHGRNSLAILLTQDVAVIPLAIVMSLMAEGGSAAEITFRVVKLLGLAAGLVAVLYVVLNLVAVRALRALSVERNRELTVLLAVVVGLGSTWAAHTVGLSPALGAFLAGMFLGSSPFATQVRSDISSLRIVLLTLFFGAVGMVADPSWIVQHLAVVLTVAFLILVGKTVIVWLILRLFGHSDGVAVATGLCLSQVGEFAFVLGSSGRASGVIDESLYMLIVSSAIVTLLLTPYLVQLAPGVAARVERWRRRVPLQNATVPGSPSFQPEIVIVGFGPAGRAVGRELSGSQRSVLVIDLNPASIQRAESLGLVGQIGDASQVDVLEHAHIQSAKIVVVTLPARTAALSVLEHVRNLVPTADVIVRSRYQIHQVDFEAAGATAVIGDEETVGRALAQRVMTLAAELDSFEGS